MRKPKYIDIHGHLNFAAYDVDREETIKRTLESDTWAVSVGTQKDTSKKAVEIAEKHDGIFAIIGLHPIHTGKSFHDEKELGEPLDPARSKEGFTSRGEVFDTTIYRSMAKNPKVLAIGECGLDYYHLEGDSKKKQEEAFISQIELANFLNKPLMLHIRNAYHDALSILKEHSKVCGNSHFFAGSWEEAKEFLDMGYFLSFTGVITFAGSYDEIIKNAPLDRIMSETDCPFVAPVPYRGKRNEPVYVSEVVKRIAEIKREDFEKVRAQLVENALKFFNISH